MKRCYLNRELSLAIVFDFEEDRYVISGEDQHLLTDATFDQLVEGNDVEGWEEIDPPVVGMLVNLAFV